MKKAFLALSLFLLPLSATADVRVASVIDGDTVVLDREIDGAPQVRLVGIQAPKLALGRAGFKDWPLADLSRRAQEELTLGKRVKLEKGTRPLDRHGRLLAHVLLYDGTWVQGEMLRLGMARVYTFADNRGKAAEMLALEGEAREEGRGIWADSFYRIRDARLHKALEKEIGSFQLVEGTVASAARIKGVVYLNFGPDWRTDFTVSIEGEALKMFVKEGIDPLKFQGRRVRARGWLERRNGPLIRITHPEQLELTQG